LARGAVRKALRYDDLCEIEFPSIGYDQQLEILKNKIEFNKGHGRLESETTHQQTLLGKLKQAILQEAIQGKLTADWRTANPNVEPASELLQRIQAEKARLIAEKKIRKEKPLPQITPEEIPFEIPDGWVAARLGDIACVVRGGSPRPAGDPRFYGGTIPFLKVADLTNDEEIYVQGHTHTISEAGLSKTRFVNEEIVLLTNSGATLGVPKILNFPSAFNDGVAAFLCLPTLINKQFLYYFLKGKTA
jgi:type I restriction enzyme S subunit